MQRFADFGQSQKSQSVRPKQKVKQVQKMSIGPKTDLFGKNEEHADLT